MDRRPDDADLPDEDDWLIIPKWREFQHYGETRKPVWIKNYTRLLHDPAYLNLSAGSRALLHGLWVLYASCSCQVQVRDVFRSLHLRVGYTQLIALNHAGFLEWSASKPLATNKDVDVDKEPPYPLTGKTQKTAQQQLQIRAFDLCEGWQGGTLDLTEKLDSLEKELHARLPHKIREEYLDRVLKRSKKPEPPPDW